jgi:anaerobic dimethyl sulfoxide reductase subunit B (iron-sulfur subunit)
MQQANASKSFGMLIDYLYCSGCHSCEVACQVEHGYQPGVFGITLTQLGPEEIKAGKWQYDFLPVPNDRCDSCAGRVAAGQLPSCVKHCQAGCISFGSIAELAGKMAHPKMVLYRL